MRAVYWFFTVLGLVIVGLLIAVIVLVTNRNDNDSQNRATVQFNNGIEYPIFGIGTSYSGNQARQAVMDAIDRGYRHVDTAYIYQTEARVGEAVNAKIIEGVISREDMFVTSKLWKEFHHPLLVRGAVLESLRTLNLTYIDLYLIHWPMSDPETTEFELIDTWHALEEMVDLGSIRSIGLSNFNATQVDYIIDNARIKPVVNQIESNPHCLNKRLIAHCQSRGLVVAAYSPLGTPGHPQFSSDSRLAINEPEILAVAQRHQRTPAQIMIRYQMQNGNIVIAKTVTRDRVITNFDVFNFNLSDEDIREIESIDYYFRTNIEESDIGHHQYPFETLECL